MASTNQGKERKIPEAVSDYFRKIGRKGGYTCISREKKRAIGKAVAPRVWALRRLRYGPSGRKPRLVMTRKAVRDLVQARNPDLVGHPVWEES